MAVMVTGRIDGVSVRCMSRLEVICQMSIYDIDCFWVGFEISVKSVENECMGLYVFYKCWRRGLAATFLKATFLTAVWQRDV